MSTNFFAKSDVITYNVTDDGLLVKLTDLTKTVDISTLNENKVSYYTYYNINDGDRPDTVSYLLYGTVQYYWTFFILNDNLKSGLHYSWPLNNVSLDKMINAEYDDYSALTFKPLFKADVASGKSDPSMVPLNNEYLNYLLLYRVDYAQTGEELAFNMTDDTKPLTKYCNILKYDNDLLTTVIHNIKAPSREAFLPTVDDTVYKLYWHNPYNSYENYNEPLTEEQETEKTKYYNCNTLKTQFIDSVYKAFLPFDKENLNISTPLEKYVFDKKYMSKSGEFAWALYKYAPYQYTVQTDLYGDNVLTDVNANARDIITNTDVIIPRYISYYDKEKSDNEAKGKIKVIRADKIRDFAQEYFNILNS